MSTYTDTLGLEEITPGDQAGLWGNTTNNNLALIDQAVTGVTPISFANLSNTVYTLESSNGALDEARAAVLNITGLATGENTVVVPNKQKTYLVRNNTGYNVTFRTAAFVESYIVGSGFSILIFCDGNNNVFPGILAPNVGPTLTTGGGTGQTTYAAGDLTYYASGTSFTKLPIGAANRFLTSSGTAPQWTETLGVANGGTGANTFTSGFVKSTGGTNALTSASTVGLGSADVSGTLPVLRGGTGNNIFTSGRVLIGNGSDPITPLAGSLPGQLLTWNGTAWIAQAPAASGGTVTQVNTSGSGLGFSLTGGPISTTGTVTLTAPTAAALATSLSGQTMNIVGSATSATNATNATNVAVTTSNTSSAFKVPFANTTASTTGNYGLLQDDAATFTYNPNTNTLTAGTFSGNLSGTLTSPLATNVGGTGAIGTPTGTGVNVLNDSPQLILPALSTATVTPGGSDQTGATPIVSDINYVLTTTPNTGVRLPTTSAAQVGRKIRIYCEGNNLLRVYPQSGGAIDNNGTNGFILLPIRGRGSYIDLVAKSTTVWVAFTGSISTSGVYSYALTDNTGAGSQIQIITNDGTNVGSKYLRVTTSGIPEGVFEIVNSAYTTTILALDDVGNLQIQGTAQKPGGGSWAVLSDSRLKDNAAPLVGALDKITSLSPVTYAWKYDTTEPTVGFIAQEVKQVMPNAVIETRPTDAQKPFIDDDKLLAIGWQNDMFAYLVGAIKELKAELDAAKAEIAALKAQP